jgi:hypothetical protein
MPRQSSFVFCLSLSSLAETPEGKKQKKKKEKKWVYIFCFVLFIYLSEWTSSSSYVVVSYGRRDRSIPPPTFSFLGPFFKNSHGDPKRKQQKKGGGPAGVEKKTRCAVLLPLFFLRVHRPLYSTHKSYVFHRTR